MVLSSEKMVKSKDCREHIDIILNDVIPKKRSHSKFDKIRSID